MNYPSYAFKSKFSKTIPSDLKSVDIAFVGECFDERGAQTIKILNEIENLLVSTFKFDPDTQEINLDRCEIKRSGLINLLSNKKRILLDITTLGLGEVLHILMAAKQGGHTSIEFLYAEPGKYTADSRNADTDDEAQQKNFKLTKNCRFQAIQGFAHEHQPNIKAYHVFFLGFEPGRMRNALEQRGTLNRTHYQMQVVLGVPAFKIGWEANSIKSHLDILEEFEISEHSISYCQANSIRESYLTIWDLYRQLGDERGCFYVSPLGTKPQAVGAALFLLETKGIDPSTSLYYDNPERVYGRSQQISGWHHVTVTLQLDK